MPEDNLKKAKLVAGLILAALVMVFTMQNTEVVEIKIFFWSLTMSRVLLVFALLIVGAIFGWLACGWARSHPDRGPT